MSSPSKDAPTASETSTVSKANLPLCRSYLYSDNNIPITSGLIIDLCTQRMDKAIFTVSRFHEGKYIYLPDLYVQYCVDDPSEYDFAMAVFGELEAWERIKKLKFFKKAYDQMVHHADVKRKSKAFKAVISEVDSGGRSAFTASKFLIDEPWKPKRTKEANTKSKKSTQEAASQHNDDLDRLREEGLIQ